MNSNACVKDYSENIMIASKVSICVPTYNRANLLPDLLDSILRQTYQNFEIIITDNSDSLETQKLVESKYADERILYSKNEKNLGMGGNARNAFSQVSGEYFTFTPDDDIWIDKHKLEQQIDILQKHTDVDIVYSNARSIDYHGQGLDVFASKYQNKNGYELIPATELLPGNNTEYFLNILTPVLRTESLLPIFKESFAFESEEYLCYFIASTNKKIGFLYDATVALREAEHHRTALEDGKIVDWKKRKDIRIRQMFNIYNTLTTLHPESNEKMGTASVQNFLAKHVLSQAKTSRSPTLMLQTLFSCYLFFRKFSLINAINVKNREGKSFG